MWSLRRKKSTSQKAGAVPTEVQDYYQAERRERVGIAWLLGIATLIVTILLAVILFFGGRWLYRKATNKNKPTTTHTPAKQTSGSSNSNNKPSDNHGDTNESPASSTPSSNTSGSTGTPNSTPAASNPGPLPQTGPAPGEDF